ncbi:MAG: diphosphomevalonate decarboxylase [Polyangiaceae bacterium]
MAASRATIVRAVAHPNIALAKYWGKKPGAGNIPAVPSLSVTLEGMKTTTTVAFDDALSADHFILNGAEAVGDPLRRALGLLDRVRALSGERRRARVTSDNDFPTTSGLASSASGFAALALAATRAAGLDLDASAVAGIARESSASAARSLFGGFAELDTNGVANAVAPATQIDMRVLVCVTTDAQKAIGSTSGMNETAKISPFYEAWLDRAPRIYKDLREALLAKDFLILGKCAEQSALAMHATALAAGIIYFNGVTQTVLAEVRKMRDEGIMVFATIDAGPHVKVLVRGSDAANAAERLAGVVGVLRVLKTRPGGAARVEAIKEGDA